MLCWDSLASALEPEEPASNADADEDRDEWWNGIKGLRLQYTDRTKVRTLHDIVDLL